MPVSLEPEVVLKILSAWGPSILLWSSVGRASELSDAAAALEPGHYVEIEMDLTVEDLQPDGPGGSMLDWADSAVWNPVDRQLSFVGKAAGSESHYRNIVYDEASSTWSFGPVPLATGNGHGYDGNTADPVTGVHYFKPYDSMTIYRLDGASWTALDDLPLHNIAGIAKAPNGLLYADRYWDVYIDDATGEQARVDVDQTYPDLAAIGFYHSITEYDPVHDAFLVGGGNDSRAMAQVVITDGVPVRTALGEAPFDFGSGEIDPHTNVTADPVTGQFVVYQKATGDFYSYDLQSDAWSLIGQSGDGNLPPLPVGDGTSAVATPVNTHGVIVYVAHDSSDAHLYVYKHAPSTPKPQDDVPPSPPTGLVHL